MCSQNLNAHIRHTNGNQWVKPKLVFRKEKESTDESTFENRILIHE